MNTAKVHTRIRLFVCDFENIFVSLVGLTTCRKFKFVFNNIVVWDICHRDLKVTIFVYLPLRLNAELFF